MLYDENDIPLSGKEETELTSQEAQINAIASLASATSDLANAIKNLNYTPTVWEDWGEPDIDAAHLNKIENGILSAVEAIKLSASAINEINGNFGNGKFKFISLRNDGGNIPKKVIQDSWNTLSDGTYIAEIISGGIYTAIIYRINNGSYGSAYIFGYDSDFSPCTINMLAGTWVENTFITNKTSYFYTALPNGITKIKNLPWGIYNLSTQDVQKIEDRPSGTSGRSMIITSGQLTGDEKITLFLCSHYSIGGLWFGRLWGTTVPEYSWDRLV